MKWSDEVEWVKGSGGGGGGVSGPLWVSQAVMAVTSPCFGSSGVGSSKQWRPLFFPVASWICFPLLPLALTLHSFLSPSFLLLLLLPLALTLHHLHLPLLLPLPLCPFPLVASKPQFPRFLHSLPTSASHLFINPRYPSLSTLSSTESPLVLLPIFLFNILLPFHTIHPHLLYDPLSPSFFFSLSPSLPPSLPPSRSSTLITVTSIKNRNNKRNNSNSRRSGLHNLL